MTSVPPHAQAVDVAHSASSAPLHILILSDGRPGHYHLSDGIAASIMRRRTAIVRRVDVRRGRWPGAVVAALTRAKLAPTRLLRLVYGIDPAPLAPVDLVVSAGAETLAASIALARLAKVPNIHYGSLRLFDENDFSLVLTSYATRASARQVYAPKPAAFDPDALGLPAPSAAWTGGFPPRMALLVGGDGKDCRFTSQDWSAIENLLVDTARRGTRWTISNSRRTAGDVSDRLQRLVAEGGPVAEMIDVRRPHARPLATLLAEVDAMLVTADSSSMISEGVFARRPVVALAPTHFRLDSEEAGYRARLAAGGAMATLAVGELTPTRLEQALRAVTPQTVNPLDALADLIASHVPELALPRTA